MIPEEAVEAAAKSEWARLGPRVPDATWETDEAEYKALLLINMRTALEAAAPFLHRVVTDEEDLLPGVVLQDKTGDVLKLMRNGEWWGTDEEHPTHVEFPAELLQVLPQALVLP